MSVGKELWDLIRDTLKADTSVMALVDDVFDKIPSSPWKAKQAHIGRGPFYGVPDDADCIDGQEITAQIDIWSRKPNRWSMDDMVTAVRSALHEKDLQLTDSALVSLRLTLWRIIDDPDPLTVHGVLQFTALVETPEDA